MQVTHSKSGLSAELHTSKEEPTPFGFTMREAAHAAKKVKDILQKYGSDGDNTAELFRFACRSNSLPHTLFAQKPVSYVSLRVDASRIDDESMASMSQFNSWQLIQFREKLASSNYGMRIGKCAFEQITHRELILYNRSAVRDVFERNSALFRNYLGKDITSDSVLEELDSKDSKDWFNGNHELHGIILGYSPQSAWAYAERHRISQKYGIDTPVTIAQLQQIERATDDPREIRSLIEVIQDMKLLDTVIEDTSLLKSSNRVNFIYLRGDAEALRLGKVYQANQRLFQELDRFGVLEYSAIAKVGGLL